MVPVERLRAVSNWHRNIVWKGTVWNYSRVPGSIPILIALEQLDAYILTSVECLAAVDSYVHHVSRSLHCETHF